MEIEQQQQQQSDESSSTESPTAALPFFAQKSFTATAIDHTQKIKSKTKSGEIIADGDTMTSLSNSEPWELRSLTDIGFESRHDRTLMGIWSRWMRRLRRLLRRGIWRRVFII
ncbi:hypothetical protein QTG54_002096 [Skeletonema marinoi]|uniref:Uncharacterized protein n=1 Tax=Skeletonema marinoi TaxID=267567 RepID=A0AAD8YK47_9STRA|nr:hypothetical protein QTG54_002096 [Skeletonema marinoi]